MPDRTAGARELLDLRTLQEEQRLWVAHNFPGRESYYPLLGALEELGELAHAHLKQLQGIRGTWAEHEASAQDAVGDIVVFLADYCSARGWDFATIVTETWNKVKCRDFRANPLNGQVDARPPESQ